jgi:hypothetical protein
MFEEMVSIGIVSRTAEAIWKSDTPGTIFWKLDWGIRQLPTWMTGIEGKHWKHAVSTNVISNFRLGGTISGFAASPEVGSGDRTKYFIMDELSKIPRPKDEQALTATQAVTDSRFILATPRGSANAYYRAIHEDSVAYRFELMWWDNPTKNRGLYKLIGLTPTAVDPVNNPLLPEYDPPSKEVLTRWEMLRKRGFDLHKGRRSSWYDHECSRLNATPQSIAQEQDADFGGSAYQIFGIEFIKKVKDSVKPPLKQGTWNYNKEDLAGEFSTVEGGPFLLWCELDQDGKPPYRRYVLAADIAAGGGGDYTSNSVLIVVDLQTGEQVAEFASKNIEVNDFADFCMSVGKWFYDAFLAWEINGLGGKFTTRVREKAYPDLFHREILWNDKVKRERKLGWYTGKETKQVMFGDLLTEVRQDKVIVRSREMSEEFSQYIRNDADGSKIEHQSAGDDPSHGDRVIALGVILQAMKQRPFIKEDETNPKDVGEGTPPLGTFAAREQEILALEQKERGVDDWDDRGPAEMMGLPQSQTRHTFDMDEVF